MNALNKPMLVSSELKIKAYDVDAMGYVSNIVYVRWFEDLRHVFLDKYYPFDKMISENKSPVLIETNVQYKLPLTIHDTATGYLWVEEMKKTKWTMRIEITQGDQIHCIGTQKGYFLDIENKRPARLPDNMYNEYNSSTEK